ncbi:hypothetical protein ACLOJK_032453 [Asimina triloba]
MVKANGELSELQQSRTQNSGEKQKITHERPVLEACFSRSFPTPPKGTKVELTQLEQVDLAIEYIRKLKVNIEELRRKRDSMIGSGGSTKDVGEVMMMKPRSPQPVVEVRDFGSTLGVIIITESDRKFKTSNVVTILEEQGVDVMSVSVSSMDDKLIQIINCQATISGVGFESESVSQELKKLVF